jgi:hypothetical protein
LFGGYHYVNAGAIPWRVRVGVTAVTAVSGDASGTQVTPYSSFWMPLSASVFVGVAEASRGRATASCSNASAHPQSAVASGLPRIQPAPMIRQIFVWPAIIVQLSPHWFAGGGRSTND